MTTLTRTVRMALMPTTGGDAMPAPGVKHGYAGFPGMVGPGSAGVGVGVFAEFEATVRGTPDARTGYLLDIKVIDRAVHETVLPIVREAVRGAFAGGGMDAGGALSVAAGRLAGALPVPLARLRWRLTPFLSLEIDMARPGTLELRQRFDFAAAHRLHAAELSDAENARLFGKCNNPRGHGHNYCVEPVVRVPVGRTGGFGLAELELLVTRELLDRFDHKHLNEDTAEFDQRRGGVNPSVENIARVFFELLAPKVREHGAELAAVSVWETDRTVATYAGA